MAKLASAVSGQAGRARRRALPFGQAAVLVANGRDHIVGLADVSATGAFLVTRVSPPVDQQVLLKLMPLPGRRELRLPARVVRVVHPGEESPQHPHGVAVQFGAVDPPTRQALEDFVNQVPRRKPHR
jgi:hypothetical protein